MTREFTTAHIRSWKAVIAVLAIALFSSCTVIVKQYQPGKPFVYKTNINLIGNFSKLEKDELITGLENQLDDSMKAPAVDRLLWSTLKKPPVFDSLSATRSLQFMNALLISRGYFSDTSYFHYEIKQEKKNQLRTTVDFFVEPGKQTKLDSISYSMRNEELQHLTDSASRQAFIKKGDPFAQGPISAELDRLTELYRNSGYLKFGRDQLIGVWDTLDISLLQPSLDPFEQFEILRKLQERRDRPTASLDITLKSVDSSRLKKFYIGDITVYPDYTLDTAGIFFREEIVDGIRVRQPGRKFKAKIFPSNIFLYHDSLYRQRTFIRTLNKLNNIGAWETVNIDQVPRGNTDTVDFIVKMTPDQKYAFDVAVEGSVNQSAISGSLLGLGLNLGLQNKNFRRGASRAAYNLRYGVELGVRDNQQFIQSKQISFSSNFYIPRFIPFGNKIPYSLRDNFRTLVSFNIANTERNPLYVLNTVNAAWGWEFQRRKRLLVIKLPNFEYSNINKKDSLLNMEQRNPSLRNIFTDGFIASLIGNYSVSGGSANRPNILRLNLEESGLLTGILKNKFLDTNLYRFIKLDAEFAKLYRFRKSSIAFRAFAGIGYEFNSTVNPLKKNNLPFFKQYFSGGPNSMRAWGLRRLGPGSVVKEFIGKDGTPDRYGDVQLEANLEYRFPLGRPFGIAVNGALFTDMGNIWFLKKGPDRLPEEIFSFNRLATDIAIGMGAGLRVDFDFFVIRFDYAYKVKDPSPAETFKGIQNKWFGYRFFDGDQFQLGINYPFIY